MCLSHIYGEKSQFKILLQSEDLFFTMIIFKQVDSLI